MSHTEVEHYAEPRAFAREVNLPLLGDVELAAVPAGAPLADLLRVPVPPSVDAVVESLAQTRQSLTLRSLLLAGYAHDPELFSLGLALARGWARRGVRVALVDLNFWSPSVVRPAGQPNEGLVDMLEFGCSFRRVAWEAVADRLWLIGPGSYLPEAERIAEHPDWDRAARVLASHADVTIYVAPHLERGGFVGRISKRMDGVLLATSVARVARGRLRDSFLELWGSDAPMIGCVGILPAPGRDRPAESGRAGAVLDPARFDAAMPGIAGAAPAVAAAPDATAVPGGGPAVEVRPPARAAERGPERALEPAAEVDSGLAAVLEREARSGEPAPARAGSGRDRWLGLAGVALIVVGGVLLGIRILPGDGSGRAFREATPTGTEPVLPAQLGTPPGPDLSAPVAPPAPELPYRVHVASFRSEETVRRLAQDLVDKGLEAWYEPAPGGSGWYRVFVGRFATHGEAAAEARRLLDRHVVDRAQAFPEPQR